jgi:hypothetical protein
MRKGTGILSFINGAISSAMNDGISHCHNGFNCVCPVKKHEVRRVISERGNGRLISKSDPSYMVGGLSGFSE